MSEFFKPGSILLVGGNLQSKSHIERFIHLAGGRDAEIVIIPTCGIRLEHYDNASPIDVGGMNEIVDGSIFRGAGSKHVEVLHTRSRDEANSNKFIELLRTARGVWFSGGLAAGMSSAYLHTETVRALARVLERGGCLGGSSSGAVIMGSHFADNRNIIFEGFGFLQNTLVKTHILSKNHHHRLNRILEENRDLLGIGLDDDSCVVIKEEFLEVFKGPVIINDDRREFFFLKKGDQYDLNTRIATRMAMSSEPFKLHEADTAEFPCLYKEILERTNKTPPPAENSDGFNMYPKPLLVEDEKLGW